MDGAWAWFGTGIGQDAAGGVIAAMVVAILFWVLKPLRLGAQRFSVWLFSVRVTTVGRIEERITSEIKSRQSRLVQPRWIVQKNGNKGEYALINAAEEGDTVYSIRVEDAYGGFVFLSTAQWSETNPLQMLRFKGWADDSMMTMRSFFVHWVDAAGAYSSVEVPVLATKSDW